MILPHTKACDLIYTSSYWTIRLMASHPRLNEGWETYMVDLTGCAIWMRTLSGLSAWGLEASSFALSRP